MEGVQFVLSDVFCFSFIHHTVTLCFPYHMKKYWATLTGISVCIVIVNQFFPVHLFVFLWSFISIYKFAFTCSLCGETRCMLRGAMYCMCVYLKGAQVGQTMMWVGPEVDPRLLSLPLTFCLSSLYYHNKGKYAACSVSNFALLRVISKKKCVNHKPY